MKFRGFVFVTLVATMAALWPGGLMARAPYAADASPPLAQTCPRDTLVWVNTNSGIYHLPGMRWYGRTAQGEYMCKKAADQAGYRSTHNGQ
jgi:hypothetical protein